MCCLSLNVSHNLQKKTKSFSHWLVCQPGSTIGSRWLTSLHEQVVRGNSMGRYVFNFFRVNLTYIGPSLCPHVCLQVQCILRLTMSRQVARLHHSLSQVRHTSTFSFSGTTILWSEGRAWQDCRLPQVTVSWLWYVGESQQQNDKSETCTQSTFQANVEARQHARLHLKRNLEHEYALCPSTCTLHIEGN